MSQSEIDNLVIFTETLAKDIERGRIAPTGYLEGSEEYCKALGTFYAERLRTLAATLKILAMLEVPRPQGITIASEEPPERLHPMMIVEDALIKQLALLGERAAKDDISAYELSQVSNTMMRIANALKENRR